MSVSEEEGDEEDEVGA